MNDRNQSSNRPGSGGSDPADVRADDRQQPQTLIAARLARHLDDRATVVPLADTPLESIVRRSGQRRQRRSTAIGVITTMAIVTGVVVGVDVLSRDARPHRITSGNDNGSSAAPDDSVDVGPANTDRPARITPVPSNLTWTAVTPDATEALAYVELPDGNTADTPLLAYSSAPGVSDSYERVLYRSDDGIHWTPTKSTVALAGGSLAATDAQHLYALATEPADATITPAPQASTPLLLRSTSDGGVTWGETRLPIDLATIAGLRGVESVRWGQLEIVAHAGTIVVLARPEIQLAIGDLVNSNITYTRDGVIAAPLPCAPVETTLAARSKATLPADCTWTGPTTTVLPDGLRNATAGTLHTWAELGIEQAAVDAYFAPPHILTSTDGSTFTEATSPATATSPESPISAELHTVADGFAMVTTTYEAAAGVSLQRLYLSRDGVRWTERTLPWSGGEHYIGDVGQTADGLLTVVANVSQGPVSDPEVAVSSDDGATWQVTQLAGLLTDADGASAQLSAGNTAIGPTGITVAATISTDPFVEHGPSSVTIDGVVVSQVDQQGTIVFTDAATGEELGRTTTPWVTGATIAVPAPSTPAVGLDPATGAPILYAADGSVRLAPTAEQMAGLYRQTYSNANHLTVLHSDDGVHWSRDDVAGMVDFAPGFLDGFVATASSLLVTVSDATRPNAMGKPTTVVLVGTLNS